MTWKKTLNIKEGTFFWVLWAAFGRCTENPTQVWNYHSALTALLPGCSDYDKKSIKTVLLPEIKAFGEKTEMQSSDRHILGVIIDTIEAL